MGDATGSGRGSGLASGEGRLTAGRAARFLIFVCLLAAGLLLSALQATAEARRAAGLSTEVLPFAASPTATTFASPTASTASYKLPGSPAAGPAGLPAPITTTLALGVGWNAITLPVSPTAPISVSAIAAALAGQGVTLQGAYGYRQDGWFGAAIAGGQVLGGDFALEPHRGYFLSADRPAEVAVQGVPFTAPATLGLDAGWNLVGFPYPPTGLAAADLVLAGRRSEGNGIGEVQRWVFGSYQGHVDGFPFNNFVIRPTEGYFVRASRPLTVAVPLGRFTPSPTPTPTITPTPTNSPTNTPTYTPTATSTGTPTPTPTLAVSIVGTPTLGSCPNPFRGTCLWGEVRNNSSQNRYHISPTVTFYNADGTTTIRSWSIEPYMLEPGEIGPFVVWSGKTSYSYSITSDAGQLTPSYDFQYTHQFEFSYLFTV